MSQVVALLSMLVTVGLFLLGVPSFIMAYQLTDEDVQRIGVEVSRRLGDTEGRIVSALSGEYANSAAVTLLTADDALQWLPTGTGAYVGSYLTPVLWGIAAGIVAYLIGYVWEAFSRLLGLAGRK